jgi:hypothetical protein
MPENHLFFPLAIQNNPLIANRYLPGSGKGLISSWW